MFSVPSDIARAFLKTNALWPHQSIQPVPLGHELFHVRVDEELLEGMAMSPLMMLAWVHGYCEGLKRGAPIGVTNAD